MYFLLALTLLISATILLVIMIRGASKQSPDLLSMRNLFLVGLIVFQYTSGIIAFIAPNLTNPYAIADRRGPGLKFVFMLLLFTVGFLAIYRSGFIADKVVALFNKKQVHVTWPKLIVLSLVFFALGAVFRLVMVQVPYFGILSIQVGAAFLALSTGLAAWAWAPRLWNPIPLLVVIFVVFGGMAIFFMDSFGRRDMLGIVLAFVWGAYYSTWRNISYKKLVFRFGILGIMGVFFLAAYSSTRFNYGIKMASLGDRVRALADADIAQGVTDLFSGQNAASYSIYFIETRPDSHSYDTLHSAKLFFALPFPRAAWPGKPNALAITSTQEINSVGMPKNWNIGPGLIGHFANDNPFLALPLYTFILAVFFKFTDGLLKKYNYDPFVVLPMGVALGQIIAVPRGELANFFGKTVFYIIGGWIAMQIIARFIQLLSPTSSMFVADDNQYGDGLDEDQSDHDTYNGYEDYQSDDHDDSTYSY